MFTTGSALLLLLIVQFATGVALAMYYVPAPQLAYDCGRFITGTLTLGWLLRGLHYWGSTFIVLAAVIHMLRVFAYGSYKSPHEVTWLIGVVLFLLILAFSLSGYLLPWDQKAYWATIVTINIARSTPLIGDQIADVLRGGSQLGALTLGAMVYGARIPVAGSARDPRDRAHRADAAARNLQPAPDARRTRRGLLSVARDQGHMVVAAVFALLIVFAMRFPAHLDEIANPADSSYVPRPEWYFLSLFELLESFPGPFEPVATIAIPGLVVGFLLALPFLDRGASRNPFARSRLLLTTVMAAIGIATVVLTMKGLADSPPKYDPDDWGPRAIAGHQLVTAPGNACLRCHASVGPAADLAITRITKDEEWLLPHMADPVAIAPGVRTEDDPAPEPVMTRFQAQAVRAYLRRTHAGEGGESAPDLSRVGARREAARIRKMIQDPTAEFS